jgi:tetratricopeptide (TPR) repeat protein
MAKASKHARPPLTFAQHLQTIRAQFPHIKPFAEEDDLYWNDEGMEALHLGSLVRAEQIFKKLLVAQPNHFDAYYGLSLVYKQQRQFSRAILFADEAIRLAQAFIDDGSLDPITFEELRSHRASLISSSPPQS